ncbi:MAG: ATP-binding cassette domain-containing protein [Acidobacteria bacterium]|nr:ATP-binding cassette domain-containing protein [Acidobacteriota bacterium]MYC80947.1 ATP-binding cassette domain-containing protein [Acidobacteriota bacterium]
MIEVDRLTKRYGNLKAVDEVSFQVEKGEILGFLGPNGAGKTTTMRILTCFLPATEGTARVAGYDVFENAMEVKRRIGYLPEHPPLYDEMTVDGYLGFVARIKGVAPEDRKRRLQEVKETVRIEGYGKKLIKHLSKGFKQRVGLAQALIHDPEVLILDEPTVGLDPNQIKEVRELIKSLSGNHTIVLSTHILPEVSMTCQRVVIISDGKIVAVDTPENLTRQQQGAAHIYMEARGSDVEAQQRLHQIEGVLSVVSRPLGEGEVSSYRIETELKQDVRGRIARSIIEGGFELLELRSLQLSLEEVFTQLTTQEEVRSQ